MLKEEGGAARILEGDKKRRREVFSSRKNLEKGEWPSKENQKLARPRKAEEKKEGAPTSSSKKGGE